MAEPPGASTALTRAFLLGRERTPLPIGPPERRFDLVFLDRDGTLNVHRPGYVDDPRRLRLLPGAARAVARLNATGARVVVVTNQRGLATGELQAQQLEQVHRALVQRLAAQGARLDAIEVCPHEKNACRCRKPLPGLLQQAMARAPWADPRRCVLFGDQPSDLAAAAAVEVQAFQVGAQSRSLADAVELLLHSPERR